MLFAMNRRPLTLLQQTRVVLSCLSRILQSFRWMEFDLTYIVLFLYGIRGGEFVDTRHVLPIYSRDFVLAVVSEYTRSISITNQLNIPNALSNSTYPLNIGTNFSSPSSRITFPNIGKVHMNTFPLCPSSTI